MDGYAQAQSFLYPRNSFHFKGALESVYLQPWTVEFEVNGSEWEQEAVLEVIGEGEIKEETKDKAIVYVQLKDEMVFLVLGLDSFSLLECIWVLAADETEEVYIF